MRSHKAAAKTSGKKPPKTAAKKPAKKLAKKKPPKTEVGRNEQLLRLLGVLRAVDRAGGCDLYELAEQFGATTRTIRRDLEALEAAGLPLVKERDGKRVRWRIGSKDKLQQISGLLDASHYLGLRVAMGKAGLGQTSGLFTALEDLSDKIEQAVGTKGREQLEQIEACFHSYEKFAYASAPPDVFWALMQAISARRICHVTYRSAQPGAQDKSYDVLPLRLFAHQGAVYLWCTVGSYSDITTLNLQRLRKLTVLEATGTVPADFDPQGLEASAFGVYTGGLQRTFRLRFSATVAPLIREKIWHPSQGLEPRAGGALELSFTCGDSPEVRSWISGWREEVEVLAPASLRADFAALGSWLSKTYASKAP